MSGDKTPEGEEQPESPIFKAAKPEASITSPREQNTWHQSQEAHYIPEDESATHIALRPDQLNDLKAQGLAEKFEIVGMEAAKMNARIDQPYKIILKEGELTKNFVDQVYDTLRSIPENERLILEKVGVKVVAAEFVTGHGGSHSVYEIAPKRLIVGMKGFLISQDTSDPTKVVSSGLATPNEDVPGSLKHEFGHGLFHALNLEHWEEFRKITCEEKLHLSEDSRTHLAHLLETDSELFAETYAFIRGRHTDRTDRLAINFPKTIDLVSKMLNSRRESQTP